MFICGCCSSCAPRVFREGLVCLLKEFADLFSLKIVALCQSSGNDAGGIT